MRIKDKVKFLVRIDNAYEKAIGFYLKAYQWDLQEICEVTPVVIVRSAEVSHNISAHH
jgi:hypothetical protein